ncbi:unnamed protein product [Vicia faba]|uniref:Uncharacterized protein n=1 Tax=Vicia faba TaxID=3906 RepID=A0AAV1B983_VICFA|nr:unnamed protein product [Vicia faba]
MWGHQEQRTLPTPDSGGITGRCTSGPQHLIPPDILCIFYTWRSSKFWGCQPPSNNKIIRTAMLICCCFLNRFHLTFYAFSTLGEALNSGEPSPWITGRCTSGPQHLDFKRIRTNPDLANARASPEFDPLLKRFHESFINAIKSIFGIFIKK